MSLLSWLRDALVGEPEAELKLSPEEAKLSGLDLKQVLDAHTAWKVRLERDLENPQSSIDVSTVAPDNLCELGKWLYGPAQKMHGHLPEFEDARRAHAVFHLAAAEVLIQRQSGNLAGAHALLHGKFRDASSDNQLELVKLFVAAQGGHHA